MNRQSPKATTAYERRCLIEGAMRNLQLARDALARAQAPKTLARVRLAISSAKGAARNADMRTVRERHA